jgi:hypothetical protein
MSRRYIAKHGASVTNRVFMTCLVKRSCKKKRLCIGRELIQRAYCSVAVSKHTHCISSVTKSDLQVHRAKIFELLKVTIPTSAAIIAIV